MNKVITADKGKVFRRISDQTIHGSEVYLGHTYYLHGELLDEPLLELPEHYEQIDEPIMEDSVVMDEDTPLVEELPEEKIKEPRKITVAEYMALEERVEQLMEYIKSQD